MHQVFSPSFKGSPCSASPSSLSYCMLHIYSCAGDGGGLVSAAAVLNDERLATKLSALKLISAIPFTFALSESKKDKSLEKEHSVKMHVHSAAATFLRSSSWMQLMTCNFVNWKSANVMSWKHKERRHPFPFFLMLMKKATKENVFFSLKLSKKIIFQVIYPS